MLIGEMQLDGKPVGFDCFYPDCFAEGQPANAEYGIPITCLCLFVGVESEAVNVVSPDVVSQ